MKLTDTFDISVFAYSDTAKRLGIDNTPPPGAIANLEALYHKLIAPLMAILPGEFNVTSGYRCDKLNAKVKGKPTSQHTKGQAADIEYFSDGVEKNQVLYETVIESGLDFDQCIKEFHDSHGNPRWIHLSYNEGHNRRMAFTIT